jgi:hypothetical protein
MVVSMDYTVSFLGSAAMKRTYALWMSLTSWEECLREAEVYMVCCNTTVNVLGLGQFRTAVLIA